MATFLLELENWSKSNGELVLFDVQIKDSPSRASQPSDARIYIFGNVIPHVQPRVKAAARGKPVQIKSIFK